MSAIPLWHHAAALAAHAHRDQVRKDGETPYIAHPGRVALVVSAVFGVTDEMILAAAWLHDVIEDTTVDFDELEAGFGPAVARIVAALSKDPRRPEREREALYDAQLAAGPWQARLIKLADVFDNLADADAVDDPTAVIAKAQRAIALAADDEELDRARAAVEALLLQCEPESDATPAE